MYNVPIMEFAVIETGGKQYTVSKGDTITIEKIKGVHKEGDAIAFDKVLLVDDGKNKSEALSYFTGRSAWALERCHYPLAPVVLTLAEFRGRYKRKDEFIRTVLKTGRVVYGKFMTEIL